MAIPAKKEIIPSNDFSNIIPKIPKVTKQQPIIKNKIMAGPLLTIHSLPFYVLEGEYYKDLCLLTQLIS